MKKTSGLNDEVVTYSSMEDLKNNETYEAMITEVNYAYSFPIQIALSPFVRGQISFNHIMSPDTLLKEGSSYLQKFKAGSMIKVTYNNGSFFMHKSQSKAKI